jgi:DNA-binding MarR family transcriptional regulator
MTGKLPLPTLLSQALVAFIIEFDNEAERRLPHHTTDYGSTARGRSAPWLTSMVMWSNCLRFVPEEGISVHDLECLARARTNWSGMVRWGYVYLEPAADDSRPKPPQSALIVRKAPAGRAAQEIWQPLVSEIEQRWRERFGVATFHDLRIALEAVAGQLDPSLPNCLPILKYGLANETLNTRCCPQRDGDSGVSQLSLPELLSRVLLAFALEFEAESAVSLAIGANVLRVIDQQGTPVSELPLRGGVSKEAIAMALTFLTSRGHAVVQSGSAGKRGKVIVLTQKGLLAQEEYHRLVGIVEDRWRQGYAQEQSEQLRQSLEPLVGAGTAGDSPLFQGLEPWPDGWRARVRKPLTLPHFPMVLHRGGFPDGS